MKHLLKKVFCGILIMATLSGIVPTPVLAEEVAWPEAPDVVSEGAVLIEASTGTVIFNKNAFESFYPASTTKLMTTLLAIEQCPLSDIITCSKDAVYSLESGSAHIALVPGEQMTLEHYLYAILLPSANDAAYAVAEHVGGTLNNFVSMMNKRVEDLGGVNTNFVNPHGLHDENHYSCPYDLAMIARKIIEYPAFSRISGSYYYELPATNLKEKRIIANTHQILRRKISCEGVFAGKTGSTAAARNCLVTCAERDGMTLIAVIMKAPDSTTVYNDTIALLEYGFQNFNLASLADAGVDTKNAFPILFEDEEALISKVSSPLTISGTSLVLPKGASYRDLTKKITLTPNDRLSAGENVIGEVSYYYADNYVGSAEVKFYSETDVIIDVSPSPSPTPSITEAATPPDNPAVSPTAPVMGSSEEESDFRPFIIGSIVGAVILVVGFYLVLIELPYRRRKKEYYRRRRQH